MRIRPHVLDCFGFAAAASRLSFVWLATALALALASSAVAAEDPTDLVVDVRLFEARNVSPDYAAMESLSFFIDTDGTGITDRQWLSTIARKVSDSFLATLVVDTVPVESSQATWSFQKRSRALRTVVDVTDFAATGPFSSSVSVDLMRRGDAERSFEHDIELRLGQTMVFSAPGLEFSASEYLSHFRDYKDADGRSELYDRLRDYSTFLIMALTLREEPASDGEPPVMLELPSDSKLPRLESSLGIEAVGTIEMEITVGTDGAPARVRILRSSVPEVNPRLLGEAPGWRFPDASGQTGRLVLEVKTEP